MIIGFAIAVAPTFLHFLSVCMLTSVNFHAQPAFANLLSSSGAVSFLFRFYARAVVTLIEPDLNHVVLDKYFFFSFAIHMRIFLRNGFY